MEVLLDPARAYTLSMATNPLTDVLPAKVRKVLYAVAFLAAWIFAAFQAADGDWKQFTGAVLAGLVPLLAASNTATPPPGD